MVQRPCIPSNVDSHTPAMQNKWILLGIAAVVIAAAILITVCAPGLTPATVLRNGETAAGDTFMLANQSGIALSFYDNALAANPDDPALLQKKAEALLRTGKIDEAEQIYQGLRVTEPDNPAVLVRIGDFCVHRGDYTAAISSYAAALAVEPDNAKTWLREGDAYLALAVTEYSARQAGSSSPLPAGFLDSLESYRSAMADYAKAQKLDPRLSVVVSTRTLAASQFEAGGKYQDLLASLKSTL